jgi:hypothetical protein
VGAGAIALGGGADRLGGDSGSGSIEAGLTYRTGSMSWGIGAISVPSSDSIRYRLCRSSYYLVSYVVSLREMVATYSEKRNGKTEMTEST